MVRVLRRCDAFSDGMRRRLADRRRRPVRDARIRYPLRFLRPEPPCRLRTRIEKPSGTIRRARQSGRLSFLTDWSADGERIFYYQTAPRNGWDVLYLERHGDVWVRNEILTTPFDEQMAAISPNGRVLAYVSDESGRDEVYIRSFPEDGFKSVVSTKGGTKPRWGPTGDELFYVQGATLMAASISTSPVAQVQSTAELFRDSVLAREVRTIPYDVSADGSRFLLVEPVNTETPPAPIRVVQNWYEEFRDRE